jgi:micrococcal nuclease
MASAKRKKLPPILIGLTVALGFSLLLNVFVIHLEWERSRVVAVVDGDSIQLADGRRVRLLGLDAPEKGRCGYEEAKLRLTRLALGRHARMKDTVLDDYGRILANVIVDQPFDEWMEYLYHRFIARDGKMPTAYLNRVMVEEGLAKWSSVSSQYKEVLTKAHEVAVTGKSGIYSDACRPKIAPFGCEIKGNIRNGVSTYFLPTCKYYTIVSVDLSYGDRWFCSEKEAIAAKFEKGCLPAQTGR